MLVLEDDLAVKTVAASLEAKKAPRLSCLYDATPARRGDVYVNRVEEALDGCF